MNHHLSLQLKDILSQLKSAELELDDLNDQLSAFEAVVDAHLGSLLDQLSALNAETSTLDAQLRHIREERLFGSNRMMYLDGAPLPPQPSSLNDQPPLGLSNRGAIHAKAQDMQSPEQKIPDIKVLYRKLARRYHPDLARNESDREVSNEQMAEINQAYTSGDLKRLMKIAGMGLPYGVELPPTSMPYSHHRNEPLSEQEKAERKLKAVRQQIARMTNLPIVKLSLEVKLAQHQGRNLLREMAADLQYKVGRKIAERDYLQAQVKASIGSKEE